MNFHLSLFILFCSLYHPFREARATLRRGSSQLNAEAAEKVSWLSRKKLMAFCHRVTRSKCLRYCFPQVFLTEYAGPLVIYLVFYTRPALIYGVEAATMPYADVVK